MKHCLYIYQFLIELVNDNLSFSFNIIYVKYGKEVIVMKYILWNSFHTWWREAVKNKWYLEWYVKI